MHPHPRYREDNGSSTWVWGCGFDARSVDVLPMTWARGIDRTAGLACTGQASAGGAASAIALNANAARTRAGRGDFSTGISILHSRETRAPTGAEFGNVLGSCLRR